MHVNSQKRVRFVSLYEKYHYDESEDKLHIERVQDATAILEANKTAFNNPGAFKSEVFNKKAEIPVILLENWLKTKGISWEECMGNDKILRRFLNDPDNKFCLTRPGKV